MVQGGATVRRIVAGWSLEAQTESGTASWRVEGGEVAEGSDACGSGPPQLASLSE
eukprot:gene13590-9730_t